MIGTPLIDCSQKKVVHNDDSETHYENHIKITP